MLSVLLSFSFVQTRLAQGVTKRLNENYGTDIQIEKVDLSSIRKVKLKSILIKDHHADTLIYAKEVNTSILNYRNVVFSDLEFGDIELAEGVMNLRTHKGDSTNNLTTFIRQFDKPKKKKKNSFFMSSSSIHLEGVDFYLFNENKKEGPIVFYKNISGYFKDFIVDGPVVVSHVESLKTLDDHEVLVKDFQTDFKYTNSRMEFLNTKLSTENSNVNGDIVFTYNKPDLLDFVNKVKIDAKIEESNIVLSDLKKFYGEFGRYDNIHFQTRAVGTINDFVVSDIELYSDRHSRLRGTVHLKNVLDKENFVLTADVNELSSNYDHLVNLLPNLLGTKVPKALDRLGFFSSSGRVRVTKSSLDARLKTIAELGLSDVDLQLMDVDKGDEASYTGRIELIDFKLGKFVNDSLIGELSMTGEVEGKGFSIDNISIDVKGHISKHQYKGYTYSNIDINGVLADKRFDGDLRANDPNLQLEFRGLADLSEDFYQYKFTADVSKADFKKLNLFNRDEVSVLKGKIDIDLSGRNIDEMQGRISFKDASYLNQNDHYVFKDFSISSNIKDDIREVRVNSTDIIQGYMRGNFRFRELPKLALNSLGSLFVNYQKQAVVDGQFLDFRFNIYSKIVDVFFPDLILAPNTVIYGEVNSDEDIFKLAIKSPRVEAYDFYIDQISLQVDNKNPLFNTLLSVGELDTKYYNLSDLNLVNVMLNDTLFVRADMIGGKEKKESYSFSLFHTINAENQQVLGMKKSALNFKGNEWLINPDNNDQNKIVYDPEIDTYAIDEFQMVTGNQNIRLGGLINGKNDRNIDLRLTDVNLIDISPDIDSVALDGKVNGNIQFRSVQGKTLPIADLVINYFSINEDFYGDFEFQASSDSDISNYNFEASLINADLKTMDLRGTLDLNQGQPTVLGQMEFDRFKANAFSPLGKNVLSNIRGLVSGEAQFSGYLSNPDINGLLTLQDAGIALPYLNVDYDFVGDTKVRLYDQTFDFTRVDVRDAAEGTRGVIAGTIEHQGFKRWILDLRLDTDNLLILNTEDYEGALYYGTGYFDGFTTLKGYSDNLVINVEGSTNPGTEFIVPLGNVSTVNKTRLIHFESLEEEEDQANKVETVVFDRLKGLNLNMNLNVTKEAVAQIVLDRATGSILRGSGTGDLRMNIDMKGKFEMFGNLVVDNGEYQFKNIVNKDFEVQSGGTISWDGNPYNANVDILAIHYARANPSVLLDEFNGTTRKIDVELYTRIRGNLSNPQFEFDIEIPNANSVVANELEFKLRSEDDKMTQFFSVLATGSFARTTNNRTNFDGNAAIAGTLAQQASNLLSNMLESDNDNFQVGVSYDIGTNNTVQDVNTDDQLGVEVSGRIADKVIVSGKVGVPVGSNTNSNVIGEVEVKLPLNEAETFQAKVYNRQNEIQFDVVEGQGYTQGAGISYRFDFNNGGEFLEKIGLKKTKEEKEMTKEELDSLKVERKEAKKEAKEQEP